MATLPSNVVEKDHRLDADASKASESLAKHRWHWTLDESNPKRVGIREYARAVGRDHKTIHGYVHGYARWAGGGGTATTLNECTERAKMSAEQEAVTEAVADANEVGIQQARKLYSSDVRQVREAVERRIKKDPDLDREHVIKSTAETMARSRKVRQRHVEEQRNRRTSQCVSILGDLATARRAITRALAEARNVEFRGDEQALLEETLERVDAALSLLRLAVVGSSDTDWDAELAKLGGES